MGEGSAPRRLSAFMAGMSRRPTRLEPILETFLIDFNVTGYKLECDMLRL
jgi:hypothetical protein